MEQVSWPGWETLRVIGRGSFGTVYEIRRSVAGDVEHAALKYLSIPASEDEIVNLQSEGMDSASITRTFREQLNDILNEYKLMRKLNDCPNVVRCDDVQYVQKQDGFGWDILIRMELLTPITKQLAGQSEIPEEQVIALGKDLSRALIRCEENHILHRDIKPQNIFVSEDGKYKLGDFGIAKAKEKTGTDTARAGTSDYMAPEVYYGEHYDKTADIYSLGIVLYWLLNNRKMPFLPQSGTAPRLQEREEARMRRLKGEKLPPPVNGSKEINRIVLKCCAFKSKDRYADANALLADLLALKRKPAPKAKRSHLLLLLCGLLASTGLVFGVMRLFGARNIASVVDPVPTLSAVAVTESPSPIPYASSTPSPTMEPTPTPLTAEETKYVEAENLLASGDKAHAAMEFYKLGDYLDAKERSFSLWKEIEASSVLSAGECHTVGLRRDGTVIAVGDNSNGTGQCTVADWSNIVSIAAGAYHTVGLRNDGTVIATGYTEHGESHVSDWTGISFIAAGGYHTVGVQKNGRVIAIGSNNYGECEVGDWEDIIAVSVGNSRYISHTVGLKSDGTVVATKFTGRQDHYSGECEVGEWTDIVAVAAGGYHTVGLRADGTVVSTKIIGAFSSAGQDDVGDWTDIVAIAAGETHTVGLRADGTVVASGWNGNGECEVSDWKEVVAIASGPAHTVGLLADGTVVAAGWDAYDQCKVSDWTDIRLPADFAALNTGIASPTQTPTPQTFYAQAVQYENNSGIGYTFSQKIDIITGSYNARLNADGTETDGKTSAGYSSVGYMQNKYGFYYADGELYYAEAREDDGLVQLYYWDGELIAARDFRYGEVEMVAEGSAFESLSREYSWLYSAAMSA